MEETEEIPIEEEIVIPSNQDSIFPPKKNNKNHRKKPPKKKHDRPSTLIHHRSIGSSSLGTALSSSLLPPQPFGSSLFQLRFPSEHIFFFFFLALDV
jgi:hypothetical protein